jgi:hypothetical protein
VKVKPAVKNRSPSQFWLWEALQLYDPPSRAGNAGRGAGGYTGSATVRSLHDVGSAHGCTRVHNDPAVNVNRVHLGQL